MAWSMSSVAFFLILAGILYVISRYWLSNTDGRPLPPGPKGLPIFGNVNDMPKPDIMECHHWLDHKDLYGPISSVTVFGQTIAIIHDADIACELLRDRSSIHSSRPTQVFSSDMVGWKHATAMSPYTDYWKLQRKIITKVITTKASQSNFDRVQEVEAAHFLLNLLHTPDKLFDHIRKEAGAVILKIIYGYTTEAHGNDPFVDLAGKTMSQFADAVVPGRWSVDIMSVLRYIPEGFPGAGFKKTAREMAAQLKQSVDQPYAFVKQQMQEKKHKASFLSQCIDDMGTGADISSVHKWAAMAMYLGGADTTVAALMAFFLAMMKFPKVQEKAREEIDRVIGSERLPLSADIDKLPYIEAIMKELHRWHSVAPMGLPHANIEEDVCRGYRIPEGSIILANTWWFTHDPQRYPEPMTFRPERFIETPIHKPEPDPRNYVFGYGRRICPGRYVADHALFITIAQSLAVFSFENPIDNGKVIEPEIKFEPGAISHPILYRASIKPRSKQHANLIDSLEQQYPWEKSDAKDLENVKWQ